MLLAVVLLLQIAAMVVVYGNHAFGTRASGLVGLATWLLLPLGSSSLACSRLLKGSAGECRQVPDALRASLSIGLPLLALFVGAFVCLNAFGE